MSSSGHPILSSAYCTERMIPGAYSLRYTPDENTISAPNGDSTFVQSGADLVMNNITLRTGDSFSSIVLGLVRYATASGRVWVDRGGTIESLAGAKVAIYDRNSQQQGSSVSDENGQFRFTGLLPGIYALTVEMPAGQVPVDMNDERVTSGRAVSVIAYTAGRMGQSAAFNVVMGQDSTGLDLGSVLPGTLGDLIWLDENGNGLQDSDEGGIPNVVVHLFRNGAEVASTVSDQYGFYTFSDLYPASYTLRVDAPAQVTPTVQTEGYTGINSVMTASGESVAVQVLSDAHNYDADMGYALVTPGVYPAGYGAGATQVWTK